MSEVAYGDSPPPNLMATFINGLFSEDAQRIIQIQRPKTLSEALRFAKEEEVIQSRLSRKREQNQNHDFQGNNNFQIDDVGSGQVNVLSGEVRRERVRCENRTRFQGRVCYNCRARGHFANDCPNRVFQGLPNVWNTRPLWLAT